MRKTQVRNLRKLFEKKFAQYARDSKEYSYAFRKFKRQFTKIPSPEKGYFLGT